MGSNSGSSSKSCMVVSDQGKAFEGMRMENPFIFKVAQIFTGLGFGFGVGRPVNLGAIPMVSEVMSATRGATGTFSGFTRHVNGALRKLVTINIEAGIGCGDGFGVGSMSEKITYKSTPADTSFGRTEKVLSNFLKNPFLREEGMDLSKVAGRLQSENNMLQMVLKHQQTVEELMEENEKLCQTLVEDLKIPPSKLQASSSSRSKPACVDCFECQRKQRKK